MARSALCRSRGRDHDAPLAIVPGGTGNVLAGNARMRGIQPALETVAARTERRLDLGVARWGGPSDGRPRAALHVASGMGFDARVMAAAEHEWKRRAALRRLRRRDGPRAGAPGAGALPHRGRREVRLDITGSIVLIGNCGDLSPESGRRPAAARPGRRSPRPVRRRRSAWLRRACAACSTCCGGPASSNDHVIRRACPTVRVDSLPAQPVETDGDLTSRWRLGPPGGGLRRARPGHLTGRRSGPAPVGPLCAVIGPRASAAPRWSHGHQDRVRRDDQRGDRRLSREHTFFSWSAQGAIDPIAIDRAEGSTCTRPRAGGSSTSTAS